MTQRERMVAGEWYNCVDDELEALRERAREAVYQHNHLPPATGGAMGPLLSRLLGSVGANARIESPFHCSYGYNIHLGTNVFINTGATFLDSAPISIGDGTLIGPNTQIYCAEHHKDHVKRAAGLEIARPVNIGSNVWIGGAATILAGVTIGSNAIVGAGAVVTRDVEAGIIVAGNPARPQESG